MAGCVYAFNQVISYTSYNYAAKITNANAEIAFAYGAGREREVMTVKKNGLLISTKNYYGGSYEEVRDSAGKTTYNYYIKAGSDVVAVVTSPTTNIKTDSKINYALFDHLGSVYAYTDEAGAITERVSYNAWGQQRDPLTWIVYKTPKNLPSFQRGFTFHEMLDMDFLVCMNARVYNPVLGRFLSPDPFVQDMGDLQSLNRYVYVLNNPLSFTDPSGYFHFKKFFRHVTHFVKKFAGTAVGIAIALETGGTGSFLVHALGGFWGSVASGAAAGFGSSFTNTVVNGGGLGQALSAGLQGGIVGGISAGITNQVGSAFQNSTMNFGNIPKSIVHGVVQGEISHIQGGDFKSGFLSGFAGEMGYHLAGNNPVLAIVAGGTASKLGGGSFANGAVSAAFVIIYNDMCHSESAPWMKTAEGQLGVAEIPGKENNSTVMDFFKSTGRSANNDETSWCSAFVNWTLNQVGIQGTNSLRAFDWKIWANGQVISDPACGALAVFPKSHVGFIAGTCDNGWLKVLGGNQGNPGSVKYSCFPSKGATFIYPNNYDPQYLK